MENSPILAAYCRVRIGPTFTPELDVWLDTSSPSDMYKCKICHANSLTLIVSRLPYVGKKVLSFNFIGNNLTRALNVELWFANYKAALGIVQK